MNGKVGVFRKPKGTEIVLGAQRRPGSPNPFAVSVSKNLPIGIMPNRQPSAINLLLPRLLSGQVTLSNLPEEVAA